jgi:hypothetical protein
MNETKFMAFTLLCIIVAQGLFAVGLPRVKASPAQEVRVTPLLTKWEDAGLNETFTVDIFVSCEDIDGLQIDLRFDTETLNVTDVKEGALILAQYPNWLTINATVRESLAPLDATKGQVLYAGAVTGAGTMSGSGVALTITFLVTKEKGSSVLHLPPGRVETGLEEGNLFFRFATKEHIFPSVSDGYYGTPILLSAYPSKVRLGEDVKLNGTVVGAEEVISVALLFKRSGEETWTNLASVNSNETGYFEYLWKKPDAGTYQVKARAHYLGEDLESAPITVIVEAPGFLETYGVWLIVAVIIIIVVVALVYYFKVVKKRRLERAAKEAEEAAEEEAEG